MTNLDQRINAYTDQLADVRLKGLVRAERFVSAKSAVITASHILMRKEPSNLSPAVAEAIFGETLKVFGDDGCWCWGQKEIDDYVGYLPRESLRYCNDYQPSHWVSVIQTIRLRHPELKSPLLTALPFGARVRVSGTTEDFAILTDGGALPLRHIIPIGEYLADRVQTAKMFLGAPYLWGGSTAAGIDCSGLIQNCLLASGVCCPRDTDIQMNQLSKNPLYETSWGNGRVQYGDLVFWHGHTGIISGSDKIIHANAHHMAVVEEDYEQAKARIAESGMQVAALLHLTHKETHKE